MDGYTPIAIIIVVTIVAWVNLGEYLMRRYARRKETDQ
jgi:hypothetical protein